jgi:hypothetical protein
MQAINFEQNCAPHWGRAQGNWGPTCAAYRDAVQTRVWLGAHGRISMLSPGYAILLHYYIIHKGQLICTNQSLIAVARSAIGHWLVQPIDQRKLYKPQPTAMWSSFETGLDFIVQHRNAMCITCPIVRWCAQHDYKTISLLLTYTTQRWTDKWTVYTLSPPRCGPDM